MCTTHSFSSSNRKAKTLLQKLHPLSLPLADRLPLRYRTQGVEQSKKKMTTSICENQHSSELKKNDSNPKKNSSYTATVEELQTVKLDQAMAFSNNIWLTEAVGGVQVARCHTRTT